MLTLLEANADTFLTAVELFGSGGVVVFPTETVYGIGTLWRNQAGWERIYQLKSRPADKRLQMLAASVEQASAAGALLSDDLRKIAARFWPGPLTLVVPATGGKSIGLRIPAHPFLLRLLGELGEPLAATSANLSGQPPATQAGEAAQLLNGDPDLVIDGGEVSATGGAASTVASLLDGNLRILRQGTITLSQLKNCLQ